MTADSSAPARAWARYAPGLLALLAAACGGGDGDIPAPSLPTITSFTAGQATYFVGSTAQLTAVFGNGTGLLQPGNVPVTSGVAVTTPVLTRAVTYRLVVSNGSSSVTRDLDLDVRYRQQLRTVPMPFARAEHAVASLPDGRVLVIGGDDLGTTYPVSVYQFDPVTELFSPFAELSTGRTAMVAVTLANGDVLVAHGSRSLTGAPVAELINGTTGSVTPTVGQPVQPRRDWSTATRLNDGRVLVAGGKSANAEATAEIYDPSTGRFTQLQATLAKGRFMHSATLLDNGKVLLYGGWTDDAQPAGGELFDPATQAFTPLPQAEAIVRGRHAAVKAADGRVWIVGGEDMDNVPIADVLVFHQDALFSTGPDLAVPRSLTAAAVLADERVVVLGGVRTFVSSQVEATTELISRPLNRADGPVMNSPRFTHTASTLPNGKVLVIGGLSDQLMPMASAEILE